MREITTHKVNGCNEAITITVMDEPGPGGACHKYLASCSKGTFLPDAEIPPADSDERYVKCAIEFQNGPIKECGTNGVTIEVLIAIAIDRLQGFQRGAFSCRDNALAITHLEYAMLRLQHRTNQRIARGVEGTHEK